VRVIAALVNFNLGQQSVAHPFLESCFDGVQDESFGMVARISIRIVFFAPSAGIAHVTFVRLLFPGENTFSALIIYHEVACVECGVKTGLFFPRRTSAICTASRENRAIGIQ